MPDGNRAVVTAVILNWNNAPDTLRCLESVFASAGVECRVLVVDNGSVDDSVELIRRRYPELALLCNGENLGYAKGNNAGIRRALEDGADYVLVLNNDTVVAPDMVARLVAAAEADRRIGMAGPSVFCLDGKKTSTLFSRGSSIDWTDGSHRHHGLFQPNVEAGDGPVEAVDFLVGCCLLVSRRCTERIGLLNADYYLNYEDAEWCVEARRHGFATVCVPGAVVWHRISATLGLGSPTNTYYMTRNALRFFWRNAPGRQRWLAVGRILARTARTVAAWTIRPQYRDDVYRRKRAANLFAVRDFFRGRAGRMPADAARACASDRN